MDTTNPARSRNENARLRRVVTWISLVCAFAVITRVGLFFAYPIAMKSYDDKRYWIAVPIVYGSALFYDSGAAALLGTMYLRGQGVAVDSEKAVYWLTRAAASGQVMAQSVLGLMYATGKGVAFDRAKAQFWLGMAANGGDREAVATLRRLAGGKAI